MPFSLTPVELEYNAVVDVGGVCEEVDGFSEFNDQLKGAIGDYCQERRTTGTLRTNWQE
jgi:hypothetical protein